MAVIYEYLIENGNVVEKIFEVLERKPGFYMIGPKGSHRFIRDEYLDVIRSNRVCTLEPNYDKYRELLIVNYEESLNRDIEKVKRRAKILHQLKQANS